MAEGMPGLNLVLLGITGIGKSASGNTILGREAFTSKKSSTSATRDVAVESGTVDGQQVTVYDTPGLFNTHMREEEILQMINEKVLQRCESGLCVFLLVIKPDRFTEKERETIEKIEKLLGEERLKKTWILFTRGDELEEEYMTIKEFINLSDPLRRLVHKYDQRYHVFNNKAKGPSDQARLLVNIIQRSLGLKDTPASLSSRRIVLLGKTGVGKSASGNTILGQKEFITVMRLSSVNRKCSVAHATVSGRSVSVVDTPGLFHTEMKPDELETEIARSVYISSPGPHAFLIVFPVSMRFTEYDQQIPQKIKIMFGEEVLKYSIVLFTRGDLLEGKPIEKLIQENCRLRDLVQRCGGRFHIFNNRDENNRDQVNHLLMKIDTMVEENGGRHYRNQKYEVQEEMERVRKKAEENRKEEERQRVKEALQRVEEWRQREEATKKLKEERRQRDEELSLLEKGSCVCS